MFKKGDRVIYKSEGVCEISDVRIENFGAIGSNETYYVLTPLKEGSSTFFVPVDNERLVGYIRRLLTAEEINGLTEELREERLEWIPDCRSRSTAFKDILSRGDRRELIVLYNTVWDKLQELRLMNKKAGSTELSTIDRAERMLYSEFAETTDISSPLQIGEVLRGAHTLSPKKLT